MEPKILLDTKIKVSPGRIGGLLPRFYPEKLSIQLLALYPNLTHPLPLNRMANTVISGNNRQCPGSSAG
jgi:hypothetical protein